MSQLGNYNPSYSLLDAMSGADETDSLYSSVALESMSKMRSMQSKKSQAAYKPVNTFQFGQAALQRAVAEMKGKVEGPITGAKVKEYQKKLEEDFTAKVRVDVTKLGVPIDTEFKLILSAEAKIQVECADPKSKEILQEYLEKSPKVCEQFGYIQALANYERARQSPTAGAWQGLRDLNTELQASVMDAFFGEALNSSMSYSSLMADFSGQKASASFYAGMDYKV